MKSHNRPTVGIVGGGLAGLAAAAQLAEWGYRVELFEAKRRLGGRAGSFVDPATQEMVDNCQHVSMGCCSAFASFCRRTEIAELFQRHDTLHFLDASGQQFDFRSTPWLPPPLHLAPAFLRLGFLTWRERLKVAQALLQMRLCVPDFDTPHQPTIGEWLRKHGQSERAIQRFWSVVLVSALGETLERASLSAARKVFVDGFMTSRDGYNIFVPTVPLGRLYERIAESLTSRGVTIHVESPVRELISCAGQRRVRGIRLHDDSERAFDFVVVAVPWKRVRELFPSPLAAALPQLADAEQIESSPITSVHLWFDRPITSLPHAVIVDTKATPTRNSILSQWLFNRGERQITGQPNQTWHYYQVVISASRELETLPREQIRQRVVDELSQIWPVTRTAKLGHWRIVTEHEAVFSVRPGLDRLRPTSATEIPNLMLAGDWTQTGWPATMEGAVRSGYSAAEAIRWQLR